MAKKRLFQVLDEMNLADTENNSTLVGVCSDLISLEYSKKQGGTKIAMGAPGNIVFDIQSKKTIPILLLVNKEEYDNLSK